MSQNTPQTFSVPFWPFICQDIPADMKLLVIEDDDSLRESLALLLESELGIQTELASSVTGAKELLAQAAGYSAVVCDYELGDGTGKEVFDYLQGQENRPPMILWSGADPGKHPFFSDPGLHAFVPKSGSHEILLEEVRKLVPASEPAPDPIESEYCRLRLTAILKQGTLASDLYVKLSEGRFLRVLKEGDFFNTEDFGRFKDKGIEFLHLKREDSKKVLNKLSQELFQLARSPTTGVEEAYKVSVSTVESISNLVQTFGFTEEVQNLTRASVILVVKNLQSNKLLASLLDKMMLDPDRYLASHSVVLSYLSCGFAGMLDWKSEATFAKLTLASFLHDVLLMDNDIARLQTRAEAFGAMDRFSVNEIDAYLLHPNTCADLIRRMNDIPPDVDLVIRQHHERPDGSGFPAGLPGSKITPLAAVFNFAHQMMLFRDQEGLKTFGPADVRRFMKTLDVEYQRGGFKALYWTLDEQLRKQGK